MGAENYLLGTIVLGGFSASVFNVSVVGIRLFWQSQRRREDMG